MNAPTPLSSEKMCLFVCEWLFGDIFFQFRLKSKFLFSFVLVEQLMKYSDASTVKNNEIKYVQMKFDIARRIERGTDFSIYAEHVQN